MRLREEFARAARERELATHTRDDVLRERDILLERNRQLEEENQRLRDAVQLSSSSSGTDSGYDGMSVTCAATRTSSLSISDGFPTLTAPALTNDVPSGLHPQSMWELYETRGFASDDLTHSGQVLKVDRKMDMTGDIVAAAIIKELPAIKMDYDEIGLDFVLR